MSDKDEGLNENPANATAIAKVKINRPATSTVSRAEETRPLAERIALLAAQAKGTDIAVLRVFELVQYTDWFIIVTGRSDRHVSAIRAHIQDALRASGTRPLSVEGTDHNQWVLIDYGDVVVHVFYEPVRAFYELERLWSEAPRLELDLSAAEVVADVDDAAEDAAVRAF